MSTPRKKQVGTSLEPRAVARIVALAQKDYRSTASIVRKCILAGLPMVEQQVFNMQPNAAALRLN